MPNNSCVFREIYSGLSPGGGCGAAAALGKSPTAEAVAAEDREEEKNLLGLFCSLFKVLIIKWVQSNEQLSVCYVAVTCSSQFVL